ncbi:MAG: nodulation protein NfeD [Candidatus Caldarchaeum sp.]
MRFFPAVLFFAAILAACAQQPAVLWIELNGYISPGTATYVEEAFAQASQYSAVLITLDTLGGSADAMLKIVETIQRSPVPVIGYVYPAGGKALSAGTYILMATHYAAMAPGTLIGSAQPVSGGEPVTDSKVLNFFAEKMGTLAESQGRNRDEAVKIVLENKNFNPQRALEARLVEAVATDVEELLAKADGSVVKTFAGEKVLRVKGIPLIKKGPSMTASAVALLSDPLVSSLLITLGILTLLFGLTSPGWGGEVAGGLMILLGLVGQGLNINIAGALLAAIGAGLLLYELVSPGFGLAGVGGILALTIGIILLGGYSPAPAFVAQEWLTQFQTTVIAIAVFAAAFLGFLAYKSFTAQKKRPREWVSMHGRAVEDIKPGGVGYIVVDGEYWRATARRLVKEHERVRIVGREGGVFVVEPEDST